MANKAIEAMAVCPFYRREGKKTITCEGVLGCDMVSVFNTPADKALHEAKYCCGEWGACPFAVLLSRKYGEQ